MEPYTTDRETERAILAGVQTGRRDDLSDTTEESIDELERLADTAGAVVVGTTLQKRPTPDPATYVGEGKLDELRAACESLDANLVIFDSELSPIQLRNLERALDTRVIDRSMLILDIFARHAATSAGKLQVELAQLQYNLPRLSGLGVQLSRLGGGIGTRGPGETKLETDRRHIHRRIAHLRGELAELKRHRDLLRSRRQKNGTPVAALVGYTNAGKSTVLNALTGADVYAEDRLFATLDPTARNLTLPDGREVCLTDTVGFIRKLPHHLIEAFKSTLEEAVFADVLIHVVDGSGPECDRHIAVVEQILSEIGASGKPTALVYNKCDLLPPGERPDVCADAERVVTVSARSGEGLDRLVESVGALLPGQKTKETLLIPFTEGAALGRLHAEQTVLSESYRAEGTVVVALLDSDGRDEYRRFLR